MAERWSVELAETLMRTATPHTLHIVALASWFDGALSLLEGWALQRRFAWSTWLIVVTTASLLPLEILALVHHLSDVRITLLLVNTLIVGYLIRCRTAFRTFPA